MKTNRLTKILAIGISVMGALHVAATFSPVILGKLGIQLYAAFSK